MDLHPLPAFADNYLWTLTADGQALVVDPGDAAVVEAWLAASGLRLTHILVTHHHPDHTGGIAALRQHHGARVLGPDEGIAGIDHIVHDGEQPDLGAFGQARVLAVPGHTLGHVAYHLPDARLLFCGDTLFSAGCGRLFEGTPTQLYHSLARLAALPDDTLVCCTHEYTLANLRFAAEVEADNLDRVARQTEVETRRRQGLPSLPVRLDAERRYNPFLRCQVPAVVAAASAHAGRIVAPGEDCLRVLRAWKDVF